MKIIFYFFILSNFNVAHCNTETKVVPGKTILKLQYLNVPMANIHQSPSKYSTIVSTITCNQAVTTYKETTVDGVIHTSFGDNIWAMTSASHYEGFIPLEYLSDEKSFCFDEAYSKFYEILNLSNTDRFMWARLYDQFHMGNSGVNK